MYNFCRMDFSIDVAAQAIANEHEMIYLPTFTRNLKSENWLGLRQ